MGSIGPAEILVVLVVALIVLGPSRLPEAARSLGKAVAELRRVGAGVQAEVRQAFAEPPPSFPTPPSSPSGTGRGPGETTVELPPPAEVGERPDPDQPPAP